MATTEYLGTGRRKTAVARVRMTPGAGKFIVNGRTMDAYFVVDSQRLLVMQPLVATESGSKFDIRVNVAGGGPTGQAGAVRHGIARALLEADAALRPTLKAHGYLTRDSRMRERKKYG